MKSKIFNLDWTKFNHKDPEQMRQLTGALQYFLALPDRFVAPQFAKLQAFLDARKQEAILAKLQEFTTTGDFPQSILPIIEKYHLTPVYDTGFEQIFDVRDFSGSGRNGFTVHTVQDGLTFRRVLPGEKIKVFPMSGDKWECYFDYYGGALGWHRQLFEDAEWWTIEDNAIAFRNKAYQFRASVFYALIEAVATVKSACISLADQNCDNCDELARAWAAALNQAAQTILRNCANKGYGLDVSNTTFVVLVPLELRGIVRQALAVNLQAFVGSERLVDFKFQLVTSQMLASTTQAYLILPKYQLKGGYRMDLTLLSDFDILSYTDTQAGWMRYGGCIGDTDQIECIDGTVPSGVGGGH